jgi:beta-xylosidase
MKQTAVEWLFNNLKSHFEHDGDLLEAVQMSFQQAKEKEKEQIMDAYDEGWSDGVHGIDLNDEYYYETFNTEEK